MSDEPRTAKSSPHRYWPSESDFSEFTRSFLVWGIGVVCVFYLMNVGGGGVFEAVGFGGGDAMVRRAGSGRLGELLPDTLPFFGNLDELVATLLLLCCFRYFGLDLTALFFPKRRPGPEEP